jgi:hypothetical protein
MMIKKQKDEKTYKCSTMLFQPEQKPTNELLPIGLSSATILQNPMLPVVPFKW